MCSVFTQWEQFFKRFFLSNTINIVKLKMKLRQWLVAVKVDKRKGKSSSFWQRKVLFTWNINKVDFGVFSVWILRT